MLHIFTAYTPEWTVFKFIKYLSLLHIRLTVDNDVCICVHSDGMTWQNLQLPGLAATLLPFAKKNAKLSWNKKYKEMKRLSQDRRRGEERKWACVRLFVWRMRQRYTEGYLAIWPRSEYLIPAHTFPFLRKSLRMKKDTVTFYLRFVTYSSFRSCFLFSSRDSLSTPERMFSLGYEIVEIIPFCFLCKLHMWWRFDEVNAAH